MTRRLAESVRCRPDDSPEEVHRKNVRRFWSKTAVNGNCVIWTAGKCTDGYGKFATGPHGRQKHFRAHRWIYEAVLGPIGDLVILHSCDTPLCVTLQHLDVGTQADNVRDSINKGRHSTAYVTDAQRLEILFLRSNGLTYRQIADATGVGQSAVRRIVILASGGTP